MKKKERQRQTDLRQTERQEKRVRESDRYRDRVEKDKRRTE